MFVTLGTEDRVMGPSLQNFGRNSGFWKIPEEINLALEMIQFRRVFRGI
jgi:hypothetical protein